MLDKPFPCPQVLYATPDGLHIHSLLNCWFHYFINRSGISHFLTDMQHISLSQLVSINYITIARNYQIRLIWLLTILFTWYGGWLATLKFQKNKILELIAKIIKYYTKLLLKINLKEKEFQNTLEVLPLVINRGG